MKYYLESLNEDKILYKFDEFVVDTIKQCILNYFTFNELKEDEELWFYRVSEDANTVGDDYLGTYVLHNGNVCKEIYKGNRVFYKKI